MPVFDVQGGGSEVIRLNLFCMSYDRGIDTWVCVRQGAQSAENFALSTFLPCRALYRACNTISPDTSVSSPLW
jgi:hypothetical protein